jgi:TolA-binding protein
MGSLKLEMDNNRDAAATNAQQLAGQIQSLNDSLDELKARMTRMQKTLGEVQGQQQQTAATLANLPPAGGAVAAPTTAAPGGAGAAPVDSAPASAAPADNGGTPAPGSPLPMPDNSAAPAGTGAPMAASGGPGASATDLYRAAYADYIAGKQQLAASEFSGLIKAYPDGNLSGNAYFYRGEMDFRAGRNAAAVKEFDQVLERYPDNSKIPAAELHKGEALIAMGQREPGIHELHALVLRFPISPEAAQAKQKLATLGARR